MDNENEDSTERERSEEESRDDMTDVETHREADYEGLATRLDDVLSKLDEMSTLLVSVKDAVGSYDVESGLVEHDEAESDEREEAETDAFEQIEDLDFNI